MKKTISKAVVLCTMALLLVGIKVNAVYTVNTGFVVHHDGPHNGMVVK